jgi:hypothetical protein
VNANDANSSWIVGFSIVDVVWVRVFVALIGVVRVVSVVSIVRVVSLVRVI